MSRVYPQYWHPSFGRHFEFAALSECRYWEFLKYPNQPTPQLAEGSLNDTSLADWFTKGLSLPYSSQDRGLEPASGLRLLIATGDVDPETHIPMISFTRESYAKIEKELGLPSTYLSNMTDNLTRTTRFSTYKENTRPLKGLAFKLQFHRPIFYQVALIHNSQTNLTHGLVVAKRKSVMLSQLLSNIRASESYGCEQPSLLLALASELMIYFSVDRLDSYDLNVKDLEEITQQEYGRRARGNPLELDFAGNTRRINHVTTRIAADISILESMLLALERIAEWKIEIEKQRFNGNKLSPGPSSPEEIDIGSSIVDEKIADLKDTCHLQLSVAKYQEKRISALIQAVYQFMAQKDAQVNIELSQASKEDSVAMKTIAVLGMFFLPGTFLAAIFAMPVFDWDGNGMPVIKAGFRYYWLITGPLTALVLISWGIAMLLPWRTWFFKEKFGAVE